MNRAFVTFAPMGATIGRDLRKAAELLLAGRLVAIPTETVYGLAANAFDPDAVLEIFQVKERPAFDPLIVHIAHRDQLGSVVAKPPPSAMALIDAFWPGPLTLVLPKHMNVPDIVTSGLDTVAIRMPGHPMTLELLRSLPFPLAAPSANPFGYVSPTTAQHVADQLGEKIPYIVDGGPCTIGVESTILGWEEGPEGEQWIVYRHGGLPIEEIERVVGKVMASTLSGSPVAPGMLASHYAPGTPLHVGEIGPLMAHFAGSRVGIISFQTEYCPAHACEVLSAAGDLDQAARGLFAALRKLDSAGCDVLIAERFPDRGLGRAINDRLGRAAAARG